jgi:hypothetical protein
MVYRGISSAIALWAALLAGMPAFADATLVVQGSEGLKSLIQVRQGRGKLSAAGMSEYVIYDTGSRTITYVEPGRQRYTQVTEAELQSGMQTAANIRETVAPYLDDLLAGLTAEQRSMIERRMGAVPGAPAAGRAPAVNLKAIARGRHSIAGLHCRASRILKNGQPAAEVCMATAASGKLSRQDFSTLDAMVSFSRSMAPGARGMLGDLADPLQFLATDIDGVPVAVRDLEHGKRYQVTTVSNAALPDALFNSYRKFQQQDVAALLIR